LPFRHCGAHAYPHPDCIWPNSRETLTNNIAGFSDSVQKKIEP
jgi:hypothetical protein